MAWPKNKEQWQKTQNQPNRTEITIVTTSQGCWKTAATKHLKSLTYSEISTLLSSNNYCPSLPAAVTTQVTRQIPRKGAGLSDTSLCFPPPHQPPLYLIRLPEGGLGQRRPLFSCRFHKCSNNSATPGPVLPQLLWSRSALKSSLPRAPRFWSQHFQHPVPMVLCFASHSHGVSLAGEITQGPRACFQQAAWVLRGSVCNRIRCSCGSDTVPARPQGGRGEGRTEQLPQTGNNRTLTCGGCDPRAGAPDLAPRLLCARTEASVLRDFEDRERWQRWEVDKAFGLLSSWVLSCLSRVWLSGTLWTVAHQAPLSMVLSRQEYWSGLPCPPPGDLSIPGIEPASLALAGRFFTPEPLGKSSSHLDLQLMQDGAAPLPSRRWWGSKGEQLGEWSLNTEQELPPLGLYSPSPGVHESEMAQRWLGSTGETRLSSRSFSHMDSPFLRATMTM